MYVCMYVLYEVFVSISAILSCLVYVPHLLRGRSAGSYPKQQLVMEPVHEFSVKIKTAFLKHLKSLHG